MEHLYEEIGIWLGVSTPSVEVFIVVMGFLATAVTFIVGPLMALFLYRQKRFLDHITYSANMLRPSGDRIELLIRTIQVLPKDDLLPTNPMFKWKLFWAIFWRCTEEDMFIRMDPDAMDVIQPAIINGLSAVYGVDYLAQMAGRKVETKRFFIAITCEKFGGIKSQKIRVIVVSENLLRRIILGGGLDENLIDFERSHHRDRLTTLHRMALEWKREQALSPDAMRVVRPVEVPVVK